MLQIGSAGYITIKNSNLKNPIIEILIVNKDRKISFIWMGSFFDHSYCDCLIDFVTIQSLTIKYKIKYE